MSHTSDEFLSEIERQPAERTVRLVYADWLDERDDPRGKLIRVEEEMRELPAFSDRFWKLKPQRNELRRVAGAEWLARMRYGTECEPVFRHGIPDGWRERWRLIREFTERWHRIPLGDIGGRQEEIAEAEAHLGRKLPSSVREWIAFAHDANMRPDRRADAPLLVFRDHYELVDVPNQPALALLCQWEGDYYWAAPHEELGIPDPPIRGYRAQFDGEAPWTWYPDDERNPLAQTVTEFTLGYAMTFTNGDCGNGVDVVLSDPAPALRELAAMFPPPARFAEGELYETENILVAVYPLTWRPGTRFRMWVFKPLPREQMPAVLWEHSSNGGVFHGRFRRPEHTVPPRHSNAEPPQLRRLDVEPPQHFDDFPPTGPDDPIPF